MSDKVVQARQAMHEEIIRSAESRLERFLSESEIEGIRRIESLMMLEPIERSFSDHRTSAEEIEKDLYYFAGRADDFSKRTI
jgi:hypothetical protein